MDIVNNIFSNIIKILFSSGAIINLYQISIDDKNLILNLKTLLDNNNFYCKQKIIIKNITKELLQRYYKIVKLYQTKHYWIGLYNPNTYLIKNSLVLYNYNFIKNIYETSVMKVLINTNNKDDYNLIFQTTDTSLINGYYKWNFSYNKYENIIILEYVKEGIINTNFLGKFILNKSYLTNLNNMYIKEELEGLKNFIVNNIKNKNLKNKI